MAERGAGGLEFFFSDGKKLGSWLVKPGCNVVFAEGHGSHGFLTIFFGGVPPIVFF